MLILSNRDVFLLGHKEPGGVKALAVWLKCETIAGTEQELWDREQNIVHGTLKIPSETAQVHTDIMLPYVLSALEN